MTKWLGLAMVLSLAACGGEVDGSTSGAPPAAGASVATREHAERFVGDWELSFVTGRDSRAHFGLTAPGAIELLRAGDGTPFEELVELPGSSLRCGVGNQWHSVGASTLVLQATCSDGQPRDVVIAFETDRSLNTTSELKVAVTSVGGDRRWRATELNGAWSLVRCTGRRCAY